MAGTCVLIHGYDTSQPNWQEVVWGRPSYNKLGRLPRGVLVALREKAEVLFLGPGVRRADGGKESQCTLAYLRENFERLWDFTEFKLSGIDPAWARARIEEIVITDDSSQNTREEIINAASFLERYINRIIVVSSPDHVMRCLREAISVLREDEQLKFFRIAKFEIFATPSDTLCSATNVEEVQIIEPEPYFYRP